MKKLVLVRHAKSSWKHPGLSDHERPLNKRGERDAIEMGRRLEDHGSRLDAVISSTAMRARTTALHFIDAFQLSDDRMILDDRLYLAPADLMLSIITELSEDYDEVALFGHNPGMTDLANRLCDLNIDNMSTCYVIELTYEIDSWKDIPQAVSKPTWRDFPRSTWGG